MNSGLTPISAYALAVDPAAPATLYAGTDGRGIFKSINGGGNWGPVNSGLPLATRYVALAIDPSAPATVISKVSGDNQTSAPTEQLRYPLVVLVTNASDIPVSGVAVDFAVTAGGGTLSGRSVGCFRLPSVFDIGRLPRTALDLGLNVNNPRSLRNIVSI